MNSFYTIGIFILCAYVFATVISSEWSYSGESGPEYWGVTYPTCDGQSQSPINIYEGDVTTTTYSQWQTYNFDTAEGVEWTLSNTGHAAQVDITGNTPLELCGGGLTGNCYRVVQFHFHWGSNPSKGSEHQISSHSYPMELHIVLYNTKYTNFDEAVDKVDGLAVLGFMHEISNTDNPNYEELVDKLKDITEEDASASLSALPLETILPDELSELTEFYRYTGSLTTPGCYESVTWTVFKDTIKISPQQLKAFRTLKFSDGTTMENNFRPVQPHNGREIMASFSPEVEWGYSFNGADQWPEYYQSCGGQSQSPIDIPTSRAYYNPDFPALTYNNYDRSAGFTMELYNSGHSAQINYYGDHNLSISGGDLPDKYRVEQFHLHWGSRAGQGSEHTVDGRAAPGELHIVHYGESLGDFTTASTQPNGLAVLSFLFKQSKKDNKALKPIIDNLSKIKHPGSKFQLDKSFALDSLLPSRRDNLYRYSGSLTTPGCYESVIWSVFEATIKISKKQLKALRQLKSEETYQGKEINLQNNFRPVQPLHGRTVTKNFPA